MVTHQLHLVPAKLLRAMDLSLEKLKEAVSLREQIQALERRISSLFGGGGQTSSTTAAGGVRRRRKRSPVTPETRAKLAAAAKARWARQGAASGGAKAGAKTRKRRSGLTAAGRKKLSDSMKARWAARRRAAGRK